MVWKQIPMTKKKTQGNIIRNQHDNFKTTNRQTLVILVFEEGMEENEKNTNNATTSHSSPISSILILYSSETGTSEDVAYKIYQLFCLSFPDTIAASHSTLPQLRISSIDDYNIELLPTEPFILFIISTTGDGEVPTTMKLFWKFLLQKALGRTSLINLSYGIFGLGDSGYDKFNAAARRLNTRLKQLGAKEFIPISLGDDQSPLGYLGTLDIWIENLTRMLNISYEKDKPIRSSPQYFLSSPSIQAQRSQLVQYLPKPQGGTQLIEITQAIITKNIRMSKTSWSQNIFHLSITLPTDPSQRVYSAGDVLVVYPPNPTDLVNLALSLYLGKYQLMKAEEDSTIQMILDESTQFEIGKYTTAFSRKNRLESGINCSLRELFTHYLDISGVPQRSFFEQLSFYASNNEEAEKLVELSSGEGVDLYQQYCVKERRGYVEILSEFRSCEIPLDKLIELIPPLSPRYYSIASAGVMNCNEVQLCVALVEYTTPLKRKRYGLCSRYLSQLPVGCQITCTLRRGSFITPNLTEPLVLIGPGTGIAPMRALIHERFPQFSQINSELSLDNSTSENLQLNIPSAITTPTSTILFYGCRSEEDDFLYKQEWRAIADYSSQHHHNLLLSINVAHSRIGKRSGRYVTHDLLENGLMVWKMIEKDNSRIYVSGSASTKMPSDVRKCLVEVISLHGEMSRENAERYLLKMEREKRYCVEAWS